MHTNHFLLSTSMMSMPAGLHCAEVLTGLSVQPFDAELNNAMSASW